MQQDEEALGQVLLPRPHRTRDVHQAEHDRVGLGLRLLLEAVVADVQRIDVGDGPPAPLDVVQLDLQLHQAPHLQGGQVVLGLQLVDLLLQAFDLAQDRPLQRDAPAQAVAHGALDVDVGGAAVDRIAGALRLEGGGFLQVGLDQVRQLQVLEEEVQELLAGQGEGELVLALAAVAGFLAAAAAAAGRLVDAVARGELLVAREDALPPSALGIVVEARLADALGRDRDRLAGADVGDLAVLQGLVDGVLDLGPGPAHEALAVDQALVLGIKAPVDEVAHGPRSLSRPC